MGEPTLKVTGLPVAKFATRERILEQGEPGSTVYVLKTGEISVVAGGEELYRTDAPGTVLGEIAALLPGAHTATVQAESSCECYVIDDLLAFFGEHPEAALNVARTLAARVSNMNQHFLAIKDEVQRLQDDAKTRGVSHRLHRMVARMDAFWGRDVRPVKA